MDIHKFRPRPHGGHPHSHLPSRISSHHIAPTDFPSNISSSRSTSIATASMPPFSSSWNAIIGVINTVYQYAMLSADQAGERIRNSSILLLHYFHVLPKWIGMATTHEKNAVPPIVSQMLSFTSSLFCVVMVMTMTIVMMMAMADLSRI